ncbi:MAG: thioredoxin family protein [Desulfobacterales bacterium]|jgi:hypothetical protein|nr:thioredoxin family protein [Desulfobacterales bacterium]
MAHNVKQIRIGKHDFGIIGLTEAIEAMTGDYKDAGDEAIAEALVQKLSKDNYIPSNVRDNYKQAFLREYKKHLNLPMTESEEDAEDLVVTVVGPGCTYCDNLGLTVMSALSELNMAARVEHVRDPKEIGRMGIMGTPAILINKDVKWVGSVPTKTQIMEWLKPFQKK